MVQDLRDELRGDVLTPSDEGYDDARHVWNARFDRTPDVIARCADAEDVAAAISWARANGHRISVKSGGHSYAGKSTADEGLLLDLSGMDDIDVDPARRTVTVGPGATWGEVDAATQEHDMATTGVTVSSVGVAGSTLGGGSGYLSRAFGHAMDNLLAVELVTADGTRVRASSDEHPDLFWAVRGAGANFGVATSFTYQLHMVGPEVLSGQIVYPFDDAGDMLRAYRDFMAAAPPQLQCFPFMFRIPPVEDFPEERHGQPALDFVVFHLDPTAMDDLQPLRELGEPILDLVAAVPYTVAQQAFDPNLPPDHRYYTRAHDVAELTDAAIETVVEHVPTMQGALTAAYFEPRGGAAAREPDATAAGGREAGYSFHLLAGWIDEDDDEEVMAWARSFHEAMRPHATGGVYVNLLGEDEDDRVPDAFSDHDRLRRIKQEWDPDNVFAGNHNVAPA